MCFHTGLVEAEHLLARGAHKRVLTRRLQAVRTRSREPVQRPTEVSDGPVLWVQVKLKMSSSRKLLSLMLNCTVEATFFLLLSKNLMALLRPYLPFWIEMIKGQVCRTL